MAHPRLTNTCCTMIVLLLLGLFPAAAGAGIALSPRRAGPGDLMVVTVTRVTSTVTGTFDGKPLHFVPAKIGYKAIIAIDLQAEPGTYGLAVSVDGGRSLKRIVRVTKKQYPVQRLTLPKDLVELSPENEARAEREQKVMAALWPGQSDRHWAGNFIDPRPGEIVTPFGVKRFINGLPKSPHTGIDVSANEGDPVKAPNSGVVVLVDEHFFSGKSIVLDHGQGIFTMFFHLSKTLVEPGQRVNKGDVIGLVGSTGRSTGPHLHWGARVMGSRVDPTELVHLELE